MEKLIVGDVVGTPMYNCKLSLILNEKGGIMDDCIFSKHDDYM